MQANQPSSRQVRDSSHFLSCDYIQATRLVQARAGNVRKILPYTCARLAHNLRVVPRVRPHKRAPGGTLVASHCKACPRGHACASSQKSAMIAHVLRSRALRSVICHGCDSSFLLMRSTSVCDVQPVRIRQVTRLESQPEIPVAEHCRSPPTQNATGCLTRIGCNFHCSWPAARFIGGLSVHVVLARPGTCAGSRRALPATVPATRCPARDCHKDPLLQRL